MNAVVQPKRLSNAHVREMYQLIAHGQERSRVAVVDPYAGVAWTLGKGSDKHAAIDHQTLAAFASVLFAPERVTEVKRKQAQQLCDNLGGISMIAIPMKDRDLFIGRLPNTSRALILIISHSTSGVSTDTIVRARAIRTRLGEPKRGDASARNQRQTARSYSLWKTIFRAVSSRFTSDTGATRVVSSGMLANALSFDKHVLAGEMFDLDSGEHLDQYHQANFPKATMVDSRAASAALIDLFNGNPNVSLLLKHIGYADANVGKVQVQIGDLDFYWLRVPYFPTLHLPFDRDWALLMYKEPRANPALDWAAIDHAALNLLRLRIGQMLESGLKTMVEPFPETQVEFQRIVDELAMLDQTDLTTRLQVGGFLREPMEIAGVTQRCQECIYYLPHRKWCDLPELPVPVEPNWWCRLWKV